MGRKLPVKNDRRDRCQQQYGHARYDHPLRISPGRFRRRGRRTGGQGRTQALDFPHCGYNRGTAALAMDGFTGMPRFDRDVTTTRTGEQISHITISHVYRHGLAETTW